MPARRRPLPETALPNLAARAATGNGVFRVADALAEGLTHSQIRTLVRRGILLSLGHGSLGLAAEVSGAEHLHRCRARLGRLPRDAVVSHASAAVLHGLLYVDAPSTPTLCVPRLEEVMHVEGLLAARVPAHHVIQVHGVHVTTPARTLVDLLRGAADHYTAQALADGATRKGIDPAAVAEVLEDCRGWPGISQARRAWELADGRMESPLESRDRLWFREGGLPEAEPQVTITDHRGVFVARVDFLFREQRTVVESDGRVKYDDAWRDKQQPERTLWEEKRREDGIRDTGLEVVRSTWADTSDNGASLVSRVRRAFERAARRRAA